MIFYFTGTGNSLFVARQFGENLVSIPQVINQDHLEFEDDEIGIVWPIYAGEPPKMVLEFLKKATFKTDYLYMILTYGKDATDAPEFIDAKSEELGIHIDYIHTVFMVDNYLPSFDMNEQIAMEKTTDKDIKQALEDVRNRKKEIPEADQAAKDFHAKAAKIFADNPGLINGEQITVTDKCIGCGICTKVCPVGNFYIEDKKAKRKQNTCEFCLACAH
ncbi:MAG: EFR1 family ferrodoxin, partial [Coprobacillus sp.]